MEWSPNPPIRMTEGSSCRGNCSISADVSSWGKTRPTIAEPVTAWRIIAAPTIDVRIAGLIDSKAGLAARALDGSDQEVSSSADVQLEALVALLTDTLRASFEHGNALSS